MYYSLYSFVGGLPSEWTGLPGYHAFKVTERLEKNQNKLNYYLGVQCKTTIANISDTVNT